jgi:hypothetical protein
MRAISKATRRPTRLLGIASSERTPKSVGFLFPHGTLLGSRRVRRPAGLGMLQPSVGEDTTLIYFIDRKSHPSKHKDRIFCDSLD